MCDSVFVVFVVFCFLFCFFCVFCMLCVALCCCCVCGFLFLYWQSLLFILFCCCIILFSVNTKKNKGIRHKTTTFCMFDVYFMLVNAKT